MSPPSHDGHKFQLQREKNAKKRSTRIQRTEKLLGYSCSFFSSRLCEILKTEILWNQNGVVFFFFFLSFFLYIYIFFFFQGRHVRGTEEDLV